MLGPSLSSQSHPAMETSHFHVYVIPISHPKGPSASSVTQTHELWKSLGKVYVLSHGTPAFPSMPQDTFLFQNALPVHRLAPLPGMPVLFLLLTRSYSAFKTHLKVTFWSSLLPLSQAQPSLGFSQASI